MKKLFTLAIAAAAVVGTVVISRDPAKRRQAVDHFRELRATATDTAQRAVTVVAERRQRRQDPESARRPVGTIPTS